MDSPNPGNSPNAADAQGATNPQNPPNEPPGPPAAIAALRNDLAALRSLLPSASDPRARQGPALRSSSPRWDVTNLRVRRVDLVEFERFRSLLALGGRVPPHWEAFAAVLRGFERSLPSSVRPFAGRVAS